MAIVDMDDDFKGSSPKETKIGWSIVALLIIGIIIAHICKLH